MRLIESGAFAMTIWITVTEPIAAKFYGSAAVMAKAFPSGFLTLYSDVFHRFYHFKESELLSGQIMCELMLGASAGFCMSASQAVTSDSDDISALAFTYPRCLTR